MTTNALQISVKLLSKKDYSSKKLKLALLKKKFSEQEIDDVILHLQDKNYINDIRYAEDRTISLLRKYYGNNYIFSKLDTEGLCISEEELRSLRVEYNFLEVDALKLTIEEKTRYLSKDEAIINTPKLIRYLISRGFDINNITNELGVDYV